MARKLKGQTLSGVHFQVWSSERLNLLITCKRQIYSEAKTSLNKEWILRQWCSVFSVSRAGGLQSEAEKSLPERQGVFAEKRGFFRYPRNQFDFFLIWSQQVLKRRCNVKLGDLLVSFFLCCCCFLVAKSCPTFSSTQRTVELARTPLSMRFPLKLCKCLSLF